MTSKYKQLLLAFAVVQCCLTAVLAVLKMYHDVPVSWWAILAPLWAPVAAVVVLAGLCAIRWWVNRDMTS